MNTKNNKIKLQKIGAAAALIEALAYLTGFIVLVFFLNPEGGEQLSATERLAFILEHKTLHQVWMLIIYVVFGIALGPLVAALHERLRHSESLSLRFGTLFGYLWVVLVIAGGMISNMGLDAVARIYPADARQATTVWIALEAVQNGLGGGVEIVGGLWVLLISLTALRAGELNRGINFIGLTVGAAGILTALPGLSELGALFGLLQIVWFAALGIHLLRKPDF
jgi:hypothetical protein